MPHVETSFTQANGKPARVVRMTRTQFGEAVQYPENAPTAVYMITSNDSNAVVAWAFFDPDIPVGSEDSDSKKKRRAIHGPVRVKQANLQTYLNLAVPNPDSNAITMHSLNMPVDVAETLVWLAHNSSRRHRGVSPAHIKRNRATYNAQAASCARGITAWLDMFRQHPPAENMYRATNGLPWVTTDRHPPTLRLQMPVVDALEHYWIAAAMIGRKMQIGCTPFYERLGGYDCHPRCCIRLGVTPGRITVQHSWDVLLTKPVSIYAHDSEGAVPMTTVLACETVSPTHITWLLTDVAYMHVGYSLTVTDKVQSKQCTIISVTPTAKRAEARIEVEVRPEDVAPLACSVYMDPRFLKRLAEATSEMVPFKRRVRLNHTDGVVRPPCLQLGNPRLYPKPAKLEVRMRLQLSAIVQFVHDVGGSEVLTPSFYKMLDAKFKPESVQSLRATRKTDAASSKIITPASCSSIRHNVTKMLQCPFACTRDCLKRMGRKEPANAPHIVWHPGMVATSPASD